MAAHPKDELVSPYPYYGGKQRAVNEVWASVPPDINNYVEPFFGSGAMLLGRPGGAGKLETVNDLDSMIPNFWRAIQKDPDKVAHFADYPVFEVDLHARHAFLLDRVPEVSEKAMADASYYDAEIAGYWVWGIALWIGDGWCDPSVALSRKLPDLYGRGHGRGIRAAGKRPAVKGKGVARQQLPTLQGVRRGVTGTPRMMDVYGARKGIRADRRESILEWMRALSDRMRDVRVMCGDWKRVLGDSVLGTTETRNQGMNPCFVFLDPPYPKEGRTKKLYSVDDDLVWFEAQAWALERGDDPDLRIVLCGYAGDGVTMPSSWREYRWKANGYGPKKNSARERIWFSPHCAPPLRQTSFLSESLS
jgi:DNA adenine methylase